MVLLPIPSNILLVYIKWNAWLMIVMYVKLPNILIASIGCLYYLEMLHSCTIILSYFFTKYFASTHQHNFNYYRMNCLYFFLLKVVAAVTVELLFLNSSFLIQYICYKTYLGWNSIITYCKICQINDSDASKNSYASKNYVCTTFQETTQVLHFLFIVFMDATVT